MAKATAPSPAELALLREMQSSLGVQERKGPGWNPDVKAYFRDCGWTDEELDAQGFDDDKTAWCGARMGSALARCGLPTLGKAASLLARNYANYGAKAEPGPGRIGVVPRGKSGWERHVFVIEEVLADGTWQTIGGNQGPSGYGKVSRAIVNPKTTKILGVRSPVPATVKDLRAAGSQGIKRADQQEVAGAALVVGGVASAVTQAAVHSAAQPIVQPVVAPAIDAGLNLTPIAEKASEVHTLTTTGIAIGNTFMQNPWMVVLIGAGVGVWWLGRTGKLRRLAAHIAGVPLSSQTA